MREEDLKIICGCELFAGVAPAEAARLLDAMDARVESYEANDLAIRLGDEVRRAGIVLAGVVAGEFLDDAGKVTTVMRFGTGALFAEAMAVLDMASMVEVRAVQASRVAWVDLGRLPDPTVVDPQDAAAHAAVHQVILNLTRLLAHKNVLLTDKAQTLSQRRLRDRIRLYLMSCASMEGQGSVAPITNQSEQRSLARAGAHAGRRAHSDRGARRYRRYRSWLSRLRRALRIQGCTARRSTGREFLSKCCHDNRLRWPSSISYLSDRK